MSTPIDVATRQKMVEEFINTGAGRRKLASYLQQPLRSQRDYLAQGRKAFKVDPLPDGALPLYDKDPDVAAYIVGEEGENVVSVLKSRRIMIPTFEIACNPEIPMSQIRERRFDLVERAQDLGRAQIQAAEDSRVFAVMDACATLGFDSLGVQNQDIAVAAPLTIDHLSDAFGAIESHDLRVARMFMNAKDYADLRKFGRVELDPVTQQELIKTGLMATLWGIQIIVTRLVPAGTVYICSESEFFGRIPVRQELSVISADDPGRRVIGFSIFEQIGIGATNPKGLARLLIARD